MRRHEREGVAKHDIQGMLNRQNWELAERLGVHPSETPTVAARFRELGLASHYWYRQHAWRNLPRTMGDIAERENIRRCLSRAATCDKPRLP